MTVGNLLVTGGSGYVGRRAIEWLLERYTGKIITTTRTPDTLNDLAARGVEVRYADFDQPDTLAEAFRGAERLLLISTNTLGVPGKRQQQHRDAIAAAETAGVAHVVYTSFGTPTAESGSAILADHYVTEQALAASTLGWTVLRNNLYMEGLIDTLKRAIGYGQLVNAIGEGRVAYVTRKDCADTAAAALADGFTGQRTLDVTGATALSQAELAAIASELAGTPIPYVTVSTEALIGVLEQGGLPAPVARMVAGFDTILRDGAFATVSDTVGRLTGVAPTAVADYLAGQRERIFG